MPFMTCHAVHGMTASLRVSPAAYRMPQPLWPQVAHSTQATTRGSRPQAACSTTTRGSRPQAACYTTTRGSRPQAACSTTTRGSRPQAACSTTTRGSRPQAACSTATRGSRCVLRRPRTTRAAVPGGSGVVVEQATRGIRGYRAVPAWQAATVHDITCPLCHAMHGIYVMPCTVWYDIACLL
jgi:hypothetical protein